MMKSRILLILLSLLLLGCLRRALVVDEYWDAVVRSRGIKPFWIASNHYMGYHVISGRTINEVEQKLQQFIARENQSKEVIFSPWLGSLVEKNPHVPKHWAVLTMHGLANQYRPVLRTPQLSRYDALQEIAEHAQQEKESTLFLYTNEQEYKLLAGLMDEGQDFFSLPIYEKADIDQVIEQAIAIMAMREIQTLIIFAEPWNFLILNGLNIYLDSIQHVYSTGVVAGHGHVKLMSEEINAQINSLLNDETLVIQAHLEK